MLGKKVGIIALLQSLDPAYSVATVVLSHVRMLKKQGFVPVLLTSEDSSITDEEVGCEVRAVIPVWQLFDYTETGNIRVEDRPRIDDVRNVIERSTKDCDILIEHDCIMQGWFAIHGLALNYIPNVRHVIHSRVNHQPIKKIPETHRVLVLNRNEIIPTEKAYQAEGRVTAIPNAMDICDYHGMEPLTREWIEKWKLHEYDYIFTYPFSATRKDAKGFDWFALFTKYMNDMGNKTAGVFLMAHGDKLPPISWDFCHFSNHMFPEHRMGVSRKIVRDFMLYSDGFLFPSVSELSPIVHLEAAASKNCVILNNILHIDHDSYNEDMQNLTNAHFELVRRRFLEGSRMLNEFRRVRRYMNENEIGKRLCDWLSADA